ncbi:MAG: LysR family transcriptional regulator [Bdellovibrionales bacterium]|nr:LysR family transcriptional regulator [Bdellovibrionales bacterium]
MDLNALPLFSEVIQNGSFSGAAKKLKIPKSTLSSKISQLEKDLGISLLQRTTRQLRLTEEGRRFYERCKVLLAEIDHAAKETTGTAGEPQGHLRLTATMEMGSQILAGLVPGFLAAYPKISVELVLTDRVVDLIAENIDLAFRSGALEDSSLVLKKLGELSLKLYASPSYLKGKKIVSPDDLSEMECIAFHPDFSETEWILVTEKQKKVVRTNSRFLSNDLTAVKNYVRSGSGIALLPEVVCLEDVQEGRLVQVLPEWRSPDSAVHIVYHRDKQTPAKVRVAIDYFYTHLKKRMGGCLDS